MTSQALESIMYQILDLKDQIDRIALNLMPPSVGEEEGVFKKLSLRNPKFVPAELGFLRTVSWLYVLYYEGGKVNVEFLSERLSVYDLDVESKLSTHLKTVHQLRTYLQHNLNPNKTQNRDIQLYCEKWFETQCKTSVPEEEEQWIKCLESLVNEAKDFLDALKNCIRKIEQDESRSQILREWDFKRKRYHPPHEFVRVITYVAEDMGRGNLDSDRFCKRFYNKWVKELELKQGNYDFELEARMLIENALLSELVQILPITGKDVMLELGIQPGPDVGKILERARMIFESSPCSKEDLLKRLKEEI